MTLTIRDSIGMMNVSDVQVFIVDDKGIQVTYNDDTECRFLDAEIVGAEE